MKSTQLQLFLAIILFLIAACQPYGFHINPIEWTYEDLRIIDPADSPESTQDIVAFYVKNPLQEPRNNTLNIRFDMLDVKTTADFDLYLALDIYHGGTRTLPINAQTKLYWDRLFIIYASGNIQAFNPAFRPLKNITTNVNRDPYLDTITIQITDPSIRLVNRPINIQAYLAPPNLPNVVDMINPVQSDGSPPPSAPVLFTFWNAFPSYTPVQALRRWDGAHTGPLGGRHGLSNLLRSAQAFRIPITLLDFMAPQQIAALEYIGGLALVHEMRSNGLLILPDTAPVFPTERPIKLPYWFIQKYIDNNRKTIQHFGLPGSQFLYASADNSDLFGGPALRYRGLFSPVTTAQRSAPIIEIISLKELITIPIPIDSLSNNEDYQPTRDGPTIATRRAFVRTAIEQTTQNVTLEAPILLLGGNLPVSTWGDPISARATFAYIRAHPWIYPVRESDLLFAKPSRMLQENSSQPTLLSNSQYTILDEMYEQFENPMFETAWHALMALLNPVYPEVDTLPRLREIYWTQIYSLLAAGEWSQNPKPIAQCDLDINLDGKLECIFASHNVLLIIDSTKGSLTYAFILDKAGLHQLVSPSYQFTTGYSEPSSWDMNRGFEADPTVIPGAFYEKYSTYNYAIGVDRITFGNMDGTVEKIYEILPGSWRVHYSATTPLQVELPIVIDPCMMDYAGWSDLYYKENLTNGWVWGIKNGLQVVIQSNVNSKLFSSLDTRGKMDITEDPNADNPPGHYLPFPMALLITDASKDIIIEISISN